ncbi:MAG: primary-amine oxidase, partial [Actinomycetota bacterium]|nr:primary-amine oxidase [Actinomycetota bacterium]
MSTRSSGSSDVGQEPLAPLTAEEIRAVVATVRATGRLTDAARFAMVVLDEPSKAALAALGHGAPPERRARLVIVPGPDCSVVEATVAVGAGEIVSWEEQPDTRPALLFEESFNAIIALHEHAGFRAAMHKRGITDLDKVQIDPWPTGNFGIPAEQGRRIVRCLLYYREHPTDNGYARPIEGVLATIDIARGEVLDLVDHGVVPLPPEPGSYYPEDNGPPRSGLRPLEITQPEGTSFSVIGNMIRWQKWSLRVSLDPLEGLVLHTVGYDDGGRTRSILHRASISEMVVPYGDPGPVHGWKNAFDAGDWGLGRMANSLARDCDCLGEIHYFDAVSADERGEPTTLANAICLHEEDYGILWKHQDLHGGRTEVRRSRRLVVSSIATVGNYEYGFYWYFYLDGSLQHEVKLTGVMSTQALAPGERSPYAPMIAPGLAAPVHQHLFCARLDFDVDGPVNEVYEVDIEPSPAGDANPWGNAFSPRASRLETEQQAKRTTDVAASRSWKIVNPASLNRLGEPVAYKLVPGATPTLLAQPHSSIAQRAGFATRNLWVTPYAPDERRAAGDYPNQHPGGAGLPRWTAADRSLLGTDIVVWHTFGVTHVPRPEDWPVMPVEYCGFLLVPVGFFDRNPALDVPRSPE